MLQSQSRTQSLPQKVTTEKALAEPLVQASFDRCSGHPETEQGRKVGGSGGVLRDTETSVRAKYAEPVCYVQESRVHPEGN